VNTAGGAYGEQARAGSTSGPQPLDSPGDSAFDDIGLGRRGLVSGSPVAVGLAALDDGGVLDGVLPREVDRAHTVTHASN
jgi:hypothetical protein